MSAVATREPEVRAAQSGSAEPPSPRLFEATGPTLEDRILATWDELVSGAPAACPVCGGELSRADGCDSCGSELS
jgi:hypothetical protein